MTAHILLIQVNGKNLVPPPNPGPSDPVLVPYGGRSNLPKEKVLALIKDAFSGATERHIEVGDGLELLVITVQDDGKVTMELERTPLKKD